MLKIYKTWRKAQKVFNKPKLSISFKKLPCVPPFCTKNGIIYTINEDVKYTYIGDSIWIISPPRVGIRIFNYCITASLQAPENSGYEYTVRYWEGVLSYILSKHKTLKEAMNCSGTYFSYKGEDVVLYFKIRPEHIKIGHLPEYYAAASQIRKKRKQAIF